MKHNDQLSKDWDHGSPGGLGNKLQAGGRELQEGAEQQAMNKGAGGRGGSRGAKGATGGPQRATGYMWMVESYRRGEGSRL